MDLQTNIIIEIAALLKKSFQCWDIKLNFVIDVASRWT